MNKSVVKIIIWSTVAFCLILAMIFISLSGDLLNFIMSPFNWEGSNLKIVKTTKIDGNDINNLDLNYTYGSVYITSYDGDKIIIEEKSNKEVDDDELFEVKQNKGTLYLKQHTSISIFNFFSFINKKMVRYIKLPTKIYDEVKTNFTSGNFNVEDIDTNNFDIKMTSGKTDISDTKSNELNVDITSGNVDITGSFDDISAYATSGNMDIKSNAASSKVLVDITSGRVDVSGAFNQITAYATSGNIGIKSDLAPSKLLIDITSGNASVTIPDNDGFILSKSKTSGTFHSDFRLDDFNTYKNGQNKYRIKITSGRVNLLKAD